MRGKLILIAWVLAILAAVVVLKGVLSAGRDSAVDLSEAITDQVRPPMYSRIISLAPCITESLFALGLGERVVGVTSFCTYPPEAATRAKVGGFYDLNYEALIALQPDLVICLPEHDVQRESLENLNLKLLTVSYQRVPEILESLTVLGQTCGVAARAAKIRADLQQRIDDIRMRAEELDQPRVLVCVGRNMGSATIEDAFFAGKNRFFDDMITLAGGVNAYEGAMIYPMISGEGLLRLDPDVIIDMVPDLTQTPGGEDLVKAQWQSLPGLLAVRNQRVHLFTEDYVAIPGPRFIVVLEKMARAIHPEVED